MPEKETKDLRCKGCDKKLGEVAKYTAPIYDKAGYITLDIRCTRCYVDNHYVAKPTGWDVIEKIDK